MGQTYTMTAKFSFKNSDAADFCRIIRERITLWQEEGLAVFGPSLDKLDLYDPLDCFKAVTNEEVYITDKGKWLVDFDASYGWESVIDDIFAHALRVTDDGSYVDVWPDNHYWGYEMRNGKLFYTTNGKTYREAEEEDDE